MINFKKEKLIKKHLGIATPDWIVQNCIKMLNEFEDVALTIPVVVQQSEQLFCGVEGGFCPYEESDRKCRAEHKCINQVAK